MKTVTEFTRLDGVTLRLGLTAVGYKPDDNGVITEIAVFPNYEKITLSNGLMLTADQVSLEPHAIVNVSTEQALIHQVGKCLELQNGSLIYTPNRTCNRFRSLRYLFEDLYYNHNVNEAVVISPNGNTWVVWFNGHTWRIVSDMMRLRPPYAERTIKDHKKDTDRLNKSYYIRPTGASPTGAK